MSINTRLFVSNLPENVDQSDLINTFSAYGEITSVDLKSKTNAPDEQKKFAFITLSASNYDIESCIKHFSNENYNGNKLYVTRARESFLERLQREREQAQKKEIVKSDLSEVKKIPNDNHAFKLENKFNSRKRKLLDSHSTSKTEHEANIEVNKHFVHNKFTKSQPDNKDCTKTLSEEQKKKIDSEKKRIESMKMKREEFKNKKMIIKTGLTSVDKVQNKKILFSDSEDTARENINGYNSGKTQAKMHKQSLFDENDSGDEVNFEIKEHFEGKKGQKVLDLQSRYKSDKRFILDERFVEEKESESEEDGKERVDSDNEEIQLEQTDEKIKQLNILGDVLGVAIKTKAVEQDSKKSKIKMGMLRYDPSQPEHAKFVVTVEDNKQELQKKNKKKRKDKEDDNNPEIQRVVETVEVSKEQFYKVSETLKEAIDQPTSFSLRSLFTKSNDPEIGSHDQDINYMPIITPAKKTKVKNPLDLGEKNPFVYDSSDSENEDIQNDNKIDAAPLITENKAVWKENLFFSQTDHRLMDGLEFFTKAIESDTKKERRELKSLMKKRIYNKERKNQMFQKKIGGRKKIMKKSFRKK